MKRQGTTADAPRGVPIRKQASSPAHAFPELLRGVPGVLWEADARTLQCTYVSPQAEDVLGHPTDEWIESPAFWTDHLHPADRERVVAFRVAQTAEALDHEIDYRMIARDGRVVWLRDVAWIVRGDDGKATALRGLMTDVTRLKSAERRLAVQQATTGILSMAESLAEAGPAVLQAVGETLGWGVAILWRHDAATTRLAPASSWSASPAYAPFLRATSATSFAPGEGLPGHVLADGRAAWVRDLQESPLPRAAAAVEAGLRSAVAFPVRSRQGLHAVIELYAPDALAPDDDVVGVLEAVGGQLGLFADRRAASQALRESDARKGAILDAALDCVITLDHEGRVVEWNAAAERVLGWSREEAAGRRLTDLALPAGPDLAALVETGERRAAGRVVELPASRRDGTAFPAELAVARVANGGRPLYVAFLRDVSERKRAEAALRESEGRLHEFLHGIPVALFAATPDERFIHANAAFARLMGFPEGARLANAPVPDLYADAKRRDEVMALLERDGEAQGLEAEFVRVDGQHIWVSLSARLLRDADGKALRLEGALEDITARKRAEAALRESEHRFRQILDSVQDMVFTKGPGSKVLYANKATCEYYGQTLEEMRARTDAGADERDLARRDLRDDLDVFTTGTTVEVMEEPNERRDGETRFFHTIKTPVFDTRGNVVEIVGVSRDITDRKRADEARAKLVSDLAGQRLRLDNIIASVPGVVWESWSEPDASGQRADFVSEHVEKMLGYTAQEWLATPGFWLSIVHPDDREEAARRAKEAAASGRGGTQQFRWRRKDGSIVWAQTWTTVVTDGAGSPVGMRGVAMDVTALKRAEEALARERSLLQTILEQMPAGVIVAEAPSGRLILANDPVNRMLRHTFRPGEGLEQYGEYQALDASGAPIPSDRLPMTRAMVAGETVANEEVHCRLADGEVVTLLVNAAPVRGADGSILAAVTDFTDITQLKRTEAQLRRQRNMLSWQRAVLESIATSVDVRTTLDTLCREAEAQARGHHFTVLLVDEDGRHLRHGAAPSLPEEYTRAVDGLPIAEGAGSCGTAAFRRESVVVRDIATDPLWKDLKVLALPLGLRACWSTPILGSDGALLGTWAVYRAAPGEPEPEDAQLVATATRLAAIAIERRRDEEQLRLRADKLARLAIALERSNRELDQFAYITSHDLKAPLRGIANLSRWLEEDVGDGLSPEAREHLDLMRGRVVRMESLIDAILEYSRVGRVKVRPEPVDTGQLVRESVDLLSPPATFRVEVQPGMPTVVAERTRLQQVFMNLIGNAVKHHDRPDGTVRVTAEDAGDAVRFRVADDGPGIDPRYHQRAFVIFQTLQPRDKVEGTGVGLALVKKIVETQGGTITLESDVGKGAAFTFTWPKITRGDG